MNVAEKETQPINYGNIPRCTYGLVETATQQQAEQIGMEIMTGKFPFSANGKAIAYGTLEGFVKIIAGKNLENC